MTPAKAWYISGMFYTDMVLHKPKDLEHVLEYRILGDFRKENVFTSIAYVDAMPDPEIWTCLVSDILTYPHKMDVMRYPAEVRYRFLSCAPIQYVVAVLNHPAAFTRHLMADEVKDTARI